MGLGAGGSELFDCRQLVGQGSFCRGQSIGGLGEFRLGFRCRIVEGGHLIGFGFQRGFCCIEFLGNLVGRFFLFLRLGCELRIIRLGAGFGLCCRRGLGRGLKGFLLFCYCAFKGFDLFLCRIARCCRAVAGLDGAIHGSLFFEYRGFSDFGRRFAQLDGIVSGFRASLHGLNGLFRSNPGIFGGFLFDDGFVCGLLGRGRVGYCFID